jgi:hypothetical protein
MEIKTMARTWQAANGRLELDSHADGRVES